MNIEIIDDYCAALAQLNRDWPAQAEGWVHYNSPLERKHALCDWRQLPESLRCVLRRLLTLPAGSLLNLPDQPVPDTLLWGAGLHEHHRGEHLDIHLDADRHPLTGLHRRANAILFVHERWERAWGGCFELWNSDLSERLALVEPRPGRLLLFETTDASYHGMPQPLTCPADVSRRSLAIYWWALPTGASRRPRAQFVATPGEWDSPEKARLRAERLRPGPHCG